MTEGWVNHCQMIINTWPASEVEHNISIKRVIKKLLGWGLQEKSPQQQVKDSSVVEHIRELLSSKARISVLDVGGGFGDNYSWIEKELGVLASKVNYSVVDNKVQCELGANYYKGKNKNIQFHTSIHQINFDLVLVIGTLQYIESWQEFIDNFVKLTINSVYISRSPLSITAPSFVTVQSICPAFGSSALLKIGESNLNVINEQELHHVFFDHGFATVKSEFISDYSKNFERLPIEYRNISYIDKLFCRITR